MHNIRIILQSLGLWLAILSLNSSCVSSSESPEAGKSDDLDVSMEQAGVKMDGSSEDSESTTDLRDDAKGSNKKLKYADIIGESGKKTKLKKASKLLPAAVTNWQEFFKSPPSAKDRSTLEQKLERWADNESAASLVKKAAAELAVGRTAAAEVSLRQALRLDSKNLEAVLELAALYLRRQQVKPAFDLLAQVREGIATSDDITQGFVFRYRYVLASAYIARGDREKGHKVLSDLIGIDKTFAPAYAALASSYLTQGKDQVAEFVLRRGIDRCKEQAMLFNLLGVIAQRRQQFETAREWYDKALESSPTLVAALVNRASLNTRSFEYAAAEEDLKQAQAIDPRNADALVAMGVIQKRQGNFAAAKESFSKAVDVSPEHAHARFNLAVLMADDLKRPNEAIRLFSEVMQTSAPDSEIRALARSYLNELKPSGQAY